ncbi:MAG: hypothetical protein A3E85_00190 [Gammaproteobacteria bacterium RIFCSPHIGHO2_12_FULL_45_12]|nr:MAG: hypothetical protein A3E85_00190 [Gammaproteobacteria bacterium RIFCSPHIGHO2_12_FULL_45_12]
MLYPNLKLTAVIPAFPCIPDDTYAPRGEVAKEGVAKYLKEVLCYSDDPPEQESINKLAPLLTLIDQERYRISDRSTIFYKSGQEKYDALLALRVAIVNAGDTLLTETIQRWLQSQSPASNQSNEILIKTQLSRLSFWYRKQTTTEQAIARLHVLAKNIDERSAPATR